MTIFDFSDRKFAPIYAILDRYDLSARSVKKIDDDNLPRLDWFPIEFDR